MSLCSHGPRFQQRPEAGDAAAIDVSPCFYVIQSIHYQVLSLEEAIVVDIFLCAWKHLVLLSINV